MEIALVLTSKCNASCTHCSTSCGPYRKEALGQDDIFRLMDEAAAIDDGEPLGFHFTGGEPFLDFDLLLAAVAYGKRLKGRVTCVTNAYWARSIEETRQKLTLLRDAGLALLAISVSRFHERYVPLRRVRLALEVAASLGLTTQLKGAVTASDLEPQGALSRWKSELQADQIHIFPVVPYLRDGAHLPEHEYCRQPGLPTDTCPDELVCIDPDGVAQSCCGQKRSTMFLELGSVHQKSLSELQRRFKHAGKQRILREQGPIAFARGAIAAGVGRVLRESYAGPCDLCVHIACEPQLRAVADQMSAAAESTELPTIPSTDGTRGHAMIVFSLEYLQILLAKAATDAQFRASFLSSPRAAAKSALQIELTFEDEQLVLMLKPHIDRFGAHGVDPEDAKNWSIGLLITAIARARNESWSLTFKTITMVETRSKSGDDWRTVFKTITMTPERAQQ